VSALDAIYRYHDGTKHHFHRFARSLGYLDWASQPNPFRSFPGAPRSAIDPQSAIRNPQFVIGSVLRHALGLSAWKQFGSSRWSLRVNPSSGNLHPTEAYLIGAFDRDPEEREPFPPRLAGDPGELPRTRRRADGARAGGRAGVYHYAADRHALERRCAFDAAVWRDGTGGDEPAWLVALTSIHWREAWKYGERAFRYCQHDLGHAIAAVRIAAALHGLSGRLLPDWSHAEIAALTGIDRDADYVDAEREEPGCILAIGSQSAILESATNPQYAIGNPQSLVAAARVGHWSGRASQLSEDHVQWTFIDEIAAATRDAGRASVTSVPSALPAPPPLYPARLLLQRRSALAFDGTSSVSRDRFLTMLARTLPRDEAPWDAIWWEPRIHFTLFVHRVDDLEPGLYILARDRAVVPRLRAACGREFLWQPASERLPLLLLAPGDCRALARRVSCDQDIAADGFFSLGMLADFDASLQTFGPSFYRHLFWESGAAGQVLYLEAEAAGARGTGIGCFYDDPVHDVLGLRGHTFQCLYHFTIGMPVEDTRLTTAPGYSWEAV
jgi:nitroreductase